MRLHTMRMAQLICCYSIFGLSTVPAVLLAVENTKVRDAWRSRLDENTGVVYQASGVQLALDADPARQSARRKEIRIAVLMRCDERKFRFDVQGKEVSQASLLILDSRGFHTCLQESGGQWDVASGRSISLGSDWLFCYPFLLAHGVVPLPPFESPRILAKKQDRSTDDFDLSGHIARFTFGKDNNLAVTVSHDANGLIDRYEVTRDNKPLLKIHNTYRRDKLLLQLGNFSVILYNSHGAVSRRLDARVTAYRQSASIPIEAFSQPRTPEAVRSILLKSFRKAVRMQSVMSLDEVAQAVQAAVGPKTQVRIDREAFKNRFEVKVNQLVFKPGEAKLSELLLHDLRKNFLDFYIDPQGVVIIPRNSAWAHSELVEFSAKDYGLGIGALRDLIHDAGTLDDWSAVGGRAHMSVDEGQEKITVFHTQSDHLRFLQRLRRKDE